MTPPREVVIRVVRTKSFEDPEVCERVCAVLSPEEKKALGRLQSPAARRDYLASQALARSAVADVLRREAAGARFRIAHGGLEPDRNVAPVVSLSVSRADGIALCAVTAAGTVGADIESVRRIGRRPLDAAAAICSRGERAVLEALPQSRRVHCLLRMWTLKEAIAKVAGLGPELPPNRITVAGPGALGTRGLEAIAGEEPAAWRCITMELASKHAAAVVVRCAPGTEIVGRVRWDKVPAEPRPA